MLIKRFIFNDFQVNTYVIADTETKEAIIIDPGMYAEQEIVSLQNFMKDYKLNVKQVILTHGHFDHWFGASYFQQQGSKVFMHNADVPLMEQSVEIAEQYGLIVKQIPGIAEYLIDGQELSLGRTSIRVFHTPGHSPGHICLVVNSERVIFTGDLLFKNSIGRTDLPGGNYEQLVNSIKEKVLSIKEDLRVLPGHGPETTLAEEILNNPFLLDIINH